METYKILVDIEDWRKRRHATESKTVQLLIDDRNWVKQRMKSLRGTVGRPGEVTKTIEWLKKVSKYVPIPSDKELEEIVKIMVLLSEERTKLNHLYNETGLKLMKSLREAMIRYFVVLSEIRARRKEYIEYWFTDEYWITEWSKMLLDLAPNDSLEKYGFKDVKAKDILYLLELELATADDVSGLENPMICLQSIEDKNVFLIIPTEAAAKEYKNQVDQIIESKITFTHWVKETLEHLKL